MESHRPRPAPDIGMEDLRTIVGPEQVVTDPDVRTSFETDWTGRYRGHAVAVVRPGSATQLAAVLAWCTDNRVAVVPQGGNTGLVGGGVPRPGAGPRRPDPCVVVSTRRLRDQGMVDRAAMQVTLGAGVTLAEWRQAARAAGCDSPVDFAARESATIGGAIATNAGGTRVVRFGTMRAQVAGVEIALADGSVIGSLHGLPKETVGVHWPSLISGSEGTLGIVTAARLRVVPWYRQTVTAMVAVDSLGDAVDVLERVRGVPTLDSIEMIHHDALALVSRHLGATPPVAVTPDGVALVVECAGHEDPAPELTDVLASSALVTDSAVASEPGPRDALLRFRDRIPEAISAATEATTPAFKLDVAVPVAHAAELLAEAQRAAAADGCRLIAFGHLAEGNLHLNHLGTNTPGRLADNVLAAAARLGGTISAEHGVGVAKVPWLGLVRTPADQRAQRAIKNALDPAGVMNPGVLFAPQVP